MDSRLLPDQSGGGQLHHPTRYAQPLRAQYIIILHKNLVSYWRNEGYNASRWVHTSLRQMGNVQTFEAACSATWLAGSEGSSKLDSMAVMRRNAVYCDG